MLYPGTQSISAASAPKILNRPFSINAEVELADDSAGVLLSMGGNDGESPSTSGTACCATHQLRGQGDIHGPIRQPGTPGRHFLSVEFAPTGEPDIKNGKGTPGTVTLFVDGEQVGTGEFPVTAPSGWPRAAAMLVGADTGSSVTPDYDPPFPFRTADPPSDRRRQRRTSGGLRSPDEDRSGQTVGHR